MGHTIYLVGARAAGKTTFGGALARQLGCNYVDTDIHLRETTGETVADIVAREGWDGFRKRESAVLRAHIVNYAKTRPVYDAYRKSGYSSKFLEAHREEVTLHKTAKAAFNESGLKKLPKVKDLNAEYSALLTKKKALYPEYRKTRDEMQEIVKAQKNVELFFAEEKDSKQVEQIR